MKTRTNLFIAAIATQFARTFENGDGPSWKMTEEGGIALDDKGNPMLVQSDGKESSVGLDTISRLNGEARQHRTKKEELETKLAEFEGIDDPKAAREALEKIKKLGDKELYESGDVEKLKQEIASQYTGQIGEKDKTIEKLQSENEQLHLNSAFNGSEFIRDNVAIPADMFRSYFGKNFKVENGQVMPYDQNGNLVYSDKRVGEVADFDEAIEKLVNNSPYKDDILKADGHRGSGGGNGGNRPGGKYISREEFNNLTPVKQAEAASKLRSGELAWKS